MTQPVRATTDPDTGDRYYAPLNPLTQRPYISVTSALSAMPKQKYLMPWVGKVVAETAVEFMRDLDEYPGINNGVVNPLEAYYDEDDVMGEPDWELLAKDLGDAWKWERDAGGDLGTLVHEAAEAILRLSKGQYGFARDMLDGGVYEPAVAHRLEGLVDFLRDNDVRVVAVEFTLYNDWYNYAGSCDLAAIVNGVPYYIDIKTNKTITPDIALQIAAYAHGEYAVNSGGEPQTMPLSRPAKGAILHLTANHCKLIEVRVDSYVFGVFTTVLQTIKRDWLNNLDKKVLGEVLYDSRKGKGVKANES